METLKDQSNSKFYLERLHECPDEGSDVLVLVEQLDEPHDTEETQERNGDHLIAGLKLNGLVGGFVSFISKFYQSVDRCYHLRLNYLVGILAC